MFFVYQLAIFLAVPTPMFFSLRKLSTTTENNFSRFAWFIETISHHNLYINYKYIRIYNIRKVYIELVWIIWEKISELGRFFLLFVYLSPGTAFVSAKSQVSIFWSSKYISSKGWMDIGGLLGDSRVIVPNRVALRVSEIHFLPHRRIFNHVFGSRYTPLFFTTIKERI